MKFIPTNLSGAFQIEIEPHCDDRGFFARTFCVNEFREKGLHTEYVQCNLSYNKHAGTIRGMHFQNQRAAESKLVRCVAGRIYDVIVDLRNDSPTKGEFFGVELSAENRHSLFVPEGFAHGFQSLEDHSEVLYMMGEYYAPEHAAGIRFDDPDFAIPWPLKVSKISKQDMSLPLWSVWANTEGKEEDV